MNGRRLAVAACAAMLLGSSCGKDPSGPQGGTLRVQLTMPAANNGLDRAILLTITGPAAPLSIAAGSGMKIYHQPLAGTMRVAVTGSLSNGATLATIQVSDLNASYGVIVHQIAQATTYQLRSPAGYSGAVVR
jgi:hypothetical protein